MMSEVPNESAPKEITVSDKIKALSNWIKKLNTKRLKKPEVAFHKELLKCSAILNWYLPKLNDESLFKIDEILYPGKTWSDKGKRQSDEFDANELFAQVDLNIYVWAYRRGLYKEDGNFDNIMCDNTFLKVVKYKKGISIDSLLIYLLDAKIAKLVCHGLKIMKIALTSDNIEYKSTDMSTLLSRFKKIPVDITKDENKKKMALFIAEQATKCYEMFEKIYKYEYDYNRSEASSAKKGIIEYINFIMNHDKIPYQTLDFLYWVFIDINVDKKIVEKIEKVKNKRKYLKYFLRAVATFCNSSLDSGLELIMDCSIQNILNIKSWKVDKEMRVIDKHHRYNIEPYLDEVIVGIDTNQLLDDEVDAGETDYPFEKFFYYDEVMKNLHLMTIFYTAYLERNSLCENEFPNGYISQGYQSDNVLMELVGFYLNNPDLLVPWYIEKTLKICPFLLFPHDKKNEQKALVIELIKHLRGELPEVKDKLSVLVRKMKKIKTLRTRSMQSRVENYPKR